MKFIKALIISAIPWYLIGWTIYEVTGKDELAFFGTSIISIAIFFIVLRKIGGDESASAMISNGFGAIIDMKNSVEFSLEQKSADLYARAEEEYENGSIDKGLWSQALVKAKGDEKLRKVEYMKLRVKQLKRNY